MNSTSATDTRGVAGVGAAIERREDRALLTGEAEYADDIQRPRMVHMAVLRSRFAHARIENVDTTTAETHEGVLAVYTHEDVEASGVPGHVPTNSSLPTSDDPESPIRVRRPLAVPDRSLLAFDTVRYVGEPIAVVIAEDRYVARDALDLIEVEYDRMEAAPDVHEAVDDAPTIHDGIDDNVAFEWESGDEAATEEAFADAPHTVSVEFDRQRVISNPIEPRAALATYAAATDHLTVWRPGQGPHRHQEYLSESLGLPQNRVRVLTPAVGGSFGTKSKPYPAELLVAWCAMQLHRPVKWQATRSENHLSSAHGRAHASEAELAFDDDGNILGLRVESHADMGAYVCGPAPAIHTSSFTSTISGQYRIPAVHCHVTGVYTTTTPISAYRGTSRPRAILLLERLVGLAADRLDVDPVELRRRNLIPADAFPYETPVGPTYDNGEYERTLDRALEILDYDRVRSEQRTLRDRDRYLGIGIACSIDEVGGVTGATGRVRFHPSGEVTAAVGTFDSGQGHGTTHAQFLADELGIPYEDIEIREGDTNDLATGQVAGGSRSVVMNGRALKTCADRVIEHARRIAAHELEAAPADVDFEDGEFRVRGAPDRAIDIQETARRAYAATDLPDDVEPGLEASASVSTRSTFPFSTHVALVEVDPEAGEIDLRRYVAVDDCGTRINPRVVEGQVQGAVVQGIGQALYEGVEYDHQGNLLTGSLMDYAMPKSIHIPDLEVDAMTTPAPDTVRGVKGIGESGTNAAPATVANAVFDALRPFGVDAIDLPITSEKLWRAVTE